VGRETGVFVACDERASGQIEDQAAIHLIVESEVEVVESLVGVAELGLLFPPLQQALATQGDLSNSCCRLEVCSTVPIDFVTNTP
jgi:hypothetical protein